MAIFAHPDDPEVACAGTLHMWADAGTEIHLVIANAGDKGVVPPGVDPAGLAGAARRRGAPRREGARDHDACTSSDIPTASSRTPSALRAELIRLLAPRRPDVVIAPDPTAVFFGDSYVNHHDHRALGWAVLDVAGSMAGGAALRTVGRSAASARRRCCSPARSNPTRGSTSEPPSTPSSARCDVTRARSVKASIVVADLVEARAAEAGRQAGVRYAEGFRRLSFAPR